MKTYVDLFCGMGGFSAALSRPLGQRDMKCVFSCDIDPTARKFYEMVYGDKPKGDIRTIKEEDIPEHDVLCAGFPCQPFSTSGNKKGFDDVRGDLFFEIMRIAKHHKPKVMILENVPHLKRMENGRYIKVIQKEIEGIGYRYYDSILNAADYVVAQARRRLYIVAIRNDIKKEFVFPDKKTPVWAIKHTLQEEADESLLYKKPYHMFGRDTNGGKDRNCNKIGFIGLKIKYNKSGMVDARKGQGMGIYDINYPAPTLTTRNRIYIMESNRVRRLSTRELFYIQGYFPFQIQHIEKRIKNEFSFAALDKLIGNSVCPLVVCNIMDSVYDTVQA